MMTHIVTGKNSSKRDPGSHPLLRASVQMESQESQKRSYWRWRKEDLFPEPSFRDWAAYRAAVSDTCHRLKDRALSRSTDANELITLPKASENPMKKCLTWWDLMWLSFGSVVGSGIFVITGQETRYHAGPAIVLSYAISGFSALLSVFCYTEFAVEIPVAGGSFSYLRVELGDVVAYLAAGNILLEAIVGAAGLARSWSSYLASMIRTDNPDLFRFRIGTLPQGFNLLDPVAVAILILANTLAVTGAKITSRFNWIACALSSFIIAFIVIVGFAHSNTSNLIPFFPHGASGVFEAAAVVYWSYTGFDMVATMAEETEKPSRDIPVGLIGSMATITLVYCLMALALTMLVNYTQVDPNAAYSVAFTQIGMNWGKYLVGVCALKGMATSLLVGSLGQGRYTTQIARSHMIPPLFALVHPRTRTPVHATVMVTAISAIVGFFSSLDVLSSVLSLSTLLIFMLMAVSLLVRRYYVRETASRNDLVKLAICLFLIVASSIGFTVFWRTSEKGWIGQAVCFFSWLSGTFWLSSLPKQRAPRIWGVPLVPWLPSLSVATNLFLIGSLGYPAYMRFMICSLIMIIYYMFVGLHATFDVARLDQQDPKVEDDRTVNFVA